MCKNNLLTLHELEEFHNYINFDIIFLYTKLEINDLIKLITIAYTIDVNIDHLFDIICEKQVLTEYFIETYYDHIHWNKIWKFQNLSIDFIIKHINKVNWKDICKYQILNEYFIKKYYKKVYWNFIVIYQKLTDQFILEFIHLLNPHKIIKYQKISFETYLLIKN